MVHSKRFKAKEKFWLIFNLLEHKNGEIFCSAGNIIFEQTQ